MDKQFFDGVGDLPYRRRGSSRSREALTQAVAFFKDPRNRGKALKLNLTGRTCEGTRLSLNTFISRHPEFKDLQLTRRQGALYVIWRDAR